MCWAPVIAVLGRMQLADCSSVTPQVCCTSASWGPTNELTGTDTCTIKWVSILLTDQALTDLPVFLSPQMTEGRHCQVHLLDDRRLELLVQVGTGCSGVVPSCPLWNVVACVEVAHLPVRRTQSFSDWGKEVVLESANLVCSWVIVAHCCWKSPDKSSCFIRTSGSSLQNLWCLDKVYVFYLLVIFLLFAQPWPKIFF